MKSVISAKRLDRLGNGKARLQQQTAIGELVSKARAAGHCGPLIVGPARSGWRADAKWLEENCPEEFGEHEKQAMPSSNNKPGRCGETYSAEISRSERSSLAASHEACKPLCPQDVETEARLSLESKPTPSEPVKLPPAQWFDRFIGYGANSRVVALADAIACVRLVITELQGPLAAAEAQVRLEGETVPVPALYAECARLTGNAACWGVVQALQLRARTQEGISSPSPLLATPMPEAAQPRWMQELNEPGGTERDWMIENGLWCG